MAKWFDETQDLVTFSVKDKIARVTLNRPDKRNALSVDLMKALQGALLEADDRRDVNVIVVAGEGKIFCAGYDLNGPYGGNTKPDERYRSAGDTLGDDVWNMQRQQDMFNIVFDIHKPVIAKVQGAAMAGGADLALQCDMVIVAEDAKIGFPAARANGTSPLHMWYYHLGPQWSKRLLMTGDVLMGKDAAKLGLVLDAVPADRLDDEVDELARRVSLVDPELTSGQKRIINLCMELQGWRSMQRLAMEFDAEMHSSRGPRRSQFRSDAFERGLKVALTNRDEGFGDGIVRAHWMRDDD